MSRWLKNVVPIVFAILRFKNIIVSSSEVASIKMYLVESVFQKNNIYSNMYIICNYTWNHIT